MKKIKGQMAEMMKEIFSNGNPVIEIEGKKVLPFIIEKMGTTVVEDMKSDPDLKQKLLQAKIDILNGKTYTIEGIVEMINQREL